MAATQIARVRRRRWRAPSSILTRRPSEHQVVPSCTSLDGVPYFGRAKDKPIQKRVLIGGVFELRVGAVKPRCRGWPLVRVPEWLDVPGRPRVPVRTLDQRCDAPQLLLIGHLQRPFASLLPTMIQVFMSGRCQESLSCRGQTFIARPRAQQCRPLDLLLQRSLADRADRDPGRLHVGRQVVGQVHGDLGHYSSSDGAYKREYTSIYTESR